MKKARPVLFGLIVLSAWTLNARSQSLSSLELANPGTVVQRGQDFAVLRSVTSVSVDGAPKFETNQVTLLENGLHYLADGEWRESEDVIEPYSAGAVAKRGPNRAIFSHELNTESVFDIEMSDGKRVRGGVRAIQVRNLRSGETVILAKVKESVTARLLPPNEILWSDAFDGIKTDVLLIWKHNMFSQEVVLLEQPELPLGWNADDARLEVLTEFIVERQPELRTVMTKVEAAQELRDDAVIHFGKLALIVGKAFGVAEEGGFAFGGLVDSGIQVRKQWERTPDGRNFLVESIDWKAAAPGLEKLPKARQADLIRLPAPNRPWPETPVEVRSPEPIQIASADYRTSGYVVDFVTIPDEGTPNTLLSGETYYIKTSYYNGSSVTIQQGATIKYAAGAYMLLYGPVTFPSAGQAPAVFTSKNDNSVGATITGSTGNPSDAIASKAIWLYYSAYSTVIQNARISWAQTGIYRDRGSHTSFGDQSSEIQRHESRRDHDHELGCVRECPSWRFCLATVESLDSRLAGFGFQHNSGD